ncbi:MAG: WD40 repeat domain-containing serine/threonine protein kinase [Gemmataceae bacterium]
MAVDDRLVELLLRWEELRDQGQVISAEELCRDCPELLDEVRRRLKNLPMMEPTIGSNAEMTNIPSPVSMQTIFGNENDEVPQGRTVPDYEILGELGRGGMGVVYKAHHKSLNRIVALKMILAGAHASVEQRVRFRGEAEAAAGLQHPNIVGVYEVGEHDHRPYFSLEYVEGCCLREVISDYPARPVNAAGLVEQLAHAVHYAHQRGIVHRDLKPANILLTRGGTPKITDFGLAKRLENDSGHTRSGDILGTPSYMAPEQAAGRVKEIGTWTDTYALGAILYEMLTGVPPFEAATTLDILNQVLSVEPVSLVRRNPRVPRDLATICWKCLEKEPRKRYSSAAALADDLQRFREGRPIAARPVGWLERTGKWARRRPAVAALVAVSSAALLILLVGGWVASLQLYQREQALEAQARANRRALIRLHVVNGNHFLDDEDEYSSLIWFARALALEDDPAREPAYRLRIGMVLRECPRLGQLWFHQDQVADVAFSPDGRWVLTASADHTAQVWDAVTGKPRLEVPLRHDDGVLCASFSPDGSRIVTASLDNTARVWDAATGRPITVLRGHQGAVGDVHFSSDGLRIITASDDRTACLWDAGTGKRLAKPLPHDGVVVRASFAPDGRRVLTASRDGSARIWQLGDDEPDLVARLSHKGSVTDAVFGPDGKQVATASEDGTARIWGSADGKPLTDPLRHYGVVLGVAFRRDGQQLATASADRTARVWDARTGQASSLVLRHYSHVSRVVFSPDGKYLATASDDNTARVWDVHKGRPLTPPLTHVRSVNQACFSPDGRRLATASATACIYELVPKPPPLPSLKHDGPVLRACFSPDGSRVLTASADRTARLWDASTGKELSVLRGHNGEVLRAAFSRDGRRIVTAGEDRTARVWDTAHDEAALLATLKGHRGTIRSAAFSPDGRRVVTASEDATARIWDAIHGTSLAELRAPEGNARAEMLDAIFSPDGRHVATGSTDGTARLWDAASGVQVGATMRHNGWVLRVVFSPDGRRLATASMDQTAQMWDADNGQALLSAPLRHGGLVFDVSFSSDGTRVLTCSEDNTAQVWSAATGEPLLPALRHRGTVIAARFSPDGSRVATASADNTGRVWDAFSGEPLTPSLWHPGWGHVTDASFNPAGDRVVTTCMDHTAVVWELRPNDWSPEDLERLAQLLGGYRINADAVSLVPLQLSALRSLWDELRSRHAGQVGPSP